MNNIDKLKDRLKTLASRSTRMGSIRFNAYEDSGGNYDDAWTFGMQDGETYLARELLEEFFGEEIKIMMIENICDVCCGKGIPISGNPCICGGTGTMIDELYGMRTMIFNLENKLKEKQIIIDKIEK